MKPKIAVAISGGVDSLFTAYLLKKQHDHIVGLHFLTGYEQTKHSSLLSKNPGIEPFDSVVEAPEYHPISRISEQLEIPIFLVDCRQTFKKKIIDYFVGEYLSGRTPNPCILCNHLIKFGVLLNTAKSMGATHLATGHYARVEKSESRDFYQLKKGVDPEKDQSYFLALLSQMQLSAAIFPLGKIAKKEVMMATREAGLMPVTKGESQDICFIKNNDYSQFLCSQERFLDSSGPIKNTHGKILGYHKGLHRYTVGQRKGINCPAPEPYYVLKLNTSENTLVVGFKQELYKSELTISNVNWIFKRPNSPIQVYTKIRYRHKGVKSTLFPLGRHSAVIKFNRPQPAVAPGQVAVCYDGDEVISGGIINE